ncbi:MAG: M23 family metallopeptidase [Betaproteobacteria bacterium]|nr:M23 family metallopeptidase [Betaproteobacteria bacterium]
MKRDIINHLLSEVSHRMLAVVGVLVLALGMVTALAFTPAPVSPEDRVEVVETLKLTLGNPLDQGDEIYAREERIVRGERLDQLLSRLGITDNDARAYFLRSPETAVLHRQLVPGRVVNARVGGDGSLFSLYFPLNGGENGLIIEEEDGRLKARETARQYETRQIMKSGEIRYSLFGATDSLGIPDSIAVQMAEIFSGDIDFHRDLRKGDRFSLVYEMRFLHGKPASAGRILAVEFINAGRTYQAFYFAREDGASYYNGEGDSLRKAFLRSPLAFSRVTSNFGRRFHPIHKTWREHKGIDYGAPTGTPIRATGDGIVQFIGVRGGYGNLIVLSHRGQYQTAYAHMSRFANSLKKGSRVTQGETIGYVGSTGWTTGPHLHYEFRVRGQHVNPLSIALPTSIPLTSAQKANFQRESADLKTMLALLKNAPVAHFE